MTHYIDTCTVENNLEFKSGKVQALVVTTTASTLTLSNSTESLIITTGSTAGQIINLGAATGYSVGRWFWLLNEATTSITVNNAGGTTLFVLTPSMRSQIFLQDNSTTNGIWIWSIESEKFTWLVDGNSGLTASNFIGSLDVSDLIFKTNNTESFRINASTGFIGVNTTNPQTRYEIVETVETDPRGLTVTQFSSTGGFGAMEVYRAARGTPASPLPLQAGDEIVVMGGLARNSSGWGQFWQAAIRFFQDETPTATTQGQRIELWTTPNGSAGQANRFRRMTIGSSGRVLIGDIADNGNDILQIGRINTTDILSKEDFEDFEFVTLSSTGNKYSIVSVASGTSAAFSIESNATGNDYVGLARGTTGTTTTGRATLDFFNSTNRIQLGSLRQVYEWRVRIPTLSDATNTFQTIIGITDSNTAGIPANGVYFYYSHGTNSGRWRCSCAASSTTGSNDSTITVTAGQWYKLRYEIDDTRTSVLFFINGVQIGDAVTLNIPASTTGMRLNAKIEKTAGGTARLMHIDFVNWKMYR
jgi:hypothetical protein